MVMFRTLLVMVASLAGMASGQVIYSANFNDGAAPGFSNAKFAASPDGTRRVLGKYGNETASLALSGLVPGRRYRVTADAYAFDSWDGNAGPDRFTIAASSGATWTTTFACASSSSRQAFPGEYGMADHPSGSGGTPCNCTWRCWSGNVGPTIYPVSLLFSAGATTETVSFSGAGLQDLCDESWGIDNVVVTDLGFAPDPSGDRCSNAVAIDMTGRLSQTVRADTTGVAVDPAAPSCPGIAGNGPSAWYTVVGTGRQLTIATCGFATIDTQLAVYCGDCSSLQCVVANDDDCPGGGARVSFCSQAGRTYVVRAFGWNGAAGAFDLTVTQSATTCASPVACTPPCTITIPAGAAAENEPPCGTNHVDTFNAGCSIEPARFSSVAVGQTVSATSGTYARNGQDYRDTDWYEFVLAAPAQITWSGAAEFPLHLGLIDGRNGCVNPLAFMVDAKGARCATVTVTSILQPGRYWAWAAPEALAGVPCGARYFASLAATPVGACSIGSGCVQVTAAECATRGGTYQGDATGCSQIGYIVQSDPPPQVPPNQPDQPPAFVDIASSGTVVPVTDDGGVTNVDIGFTFGFYDTVYTRVGISPNGYLSFTDRLDVPRPTAIPSTTLPNNLIAPRWSNLNPPANSVRRQTLGSAPERRFIVQWSNVPMFGFTDSNTFQVVLFEATGNIQFCYRSVSPPRYEGEFRAGIENAAGVRGTSVSAAQIATNWTHLFTRSSLTPPVAVVGGPYAFAAATPSITADASGSYDPDRPGGSSRGISTFQWDLGADGLADDVGRTNAQQPIPLAAAIAKGLSVVQNVPLRVYVGDADGLQGSDQTLVSYVNTPPVADAGGPYGPVLPGTTVELQGSFVDPDLAMGVGETTAMEWDTRPAATAAEVGDGFATTATPTVTFAQLRAWHASGLRTLYFNVADRRGAVSSAAASFSVALPDLQFASAPTAPASARFGDTIRVQWSATNGGPGEAAGPWNDRVYLSDNATLDGGDVALVLEAGPTTLAPSGGYVRDVSVTLPRNYAASGTRHLLVRLDDGGAVEELGESNNIAAVSIQLQPTPSPDLSTLSVVVPSEAFFGDSFDVGYVVRNLGPGTAIDAWSDSIFLSSDSTLDVGDRLVRSVAATPPLATNASYARTTAASVAVDPTLPEGEYFLLVKANANGGQFESNSANNVAASGRIRLLRRLYPDLEAGGVTAPTSAAAGEPTVIAFTVTNIGPREARGGWADRVYLSEDATLQPASDIALTPVIQRATPVAPEGGSYAASQAFVLPDRPGTYRVLVRCDDGGTLDEGGAESNNIAVSAGTMVLLPAPKPDLAVTSASAPSQAQAGASVVVDYAVTNMGTAAAAGSWTDGVYLSVDATLEASDRLLRSSPANAAPLAVGGVYTRSRSVTLPDDVQNATTFHLIVKADIDEAVADVGRVNNARVASVIRVDPNPAPNLQVAIVEAPSAVAFGQTVTLRWTVSNRGNRAANGSWRDQVVLSRDLTLSSDDLLIGSVLVSDASPLLPDSGSYSRTLLGQVPLVASAIPGFYHFLVRTDVNGAVGESNETDNDATFGPVTVSNPPLPNLTVAISRVPATLTLGTPAVIEYTITNIGMASTGTTPWTLTIFESPDALPGSRREVAANVTVDQAIAAGASLSGSVEVPVADFRSPGVVFIACADSANRVVESVEGDNCGTSAATPCLRPDLVPVSIDAPSSVTAGSRVAVSWTVRNAGPTVAMPYWVDAVHLAPSRTAESTLLLANQAHGERLEQGASYTEHATVTIPDDASGTYYFTVIADSDDRVYEAAGEGNGRLVSTVATTVVQPARPDLAVTEVSMPPNGLGGTAMALSYTVANRGEAAATTSWIERVQVSRDRTLDASDVLLASSVNVAPLGPGASYERTLNLEYPSQEGQWYVIVTVDAANSVRESAGAGESNNTYVSSWPLLVSTFTATAEADVDEAPAGTTVRISGRASIEGTSTPAPGVPVRVQVTVRGYTRFLNMVADPEGRYSVAFEPGPTEGGLYMVGAGPSHRTAPGSDFFRLWSYRVATPESITLYPGRSVMTTLTVENMGDASISGMSAAVGPLPPGVTAETRFPAGTVIAGLSTLPVEVTIRASAQAGVGAFAAPIQIGSATPAPAATVAIPVTVGSPVARLEIDAATLDAGRLRADMLLGQVTTVQFKVRNVGGAASGPIVVVLPTAHWLNLATPQVMSPLASGEEASVVLSLVPDRSMTLGDYPGALSVGDGASLVALDFLFRATSERRGDLVVTVTDEFTYYDEANGFPAVRNAQVVVRDHDTRQIVATAMSDENGRALFEQLPERFYDVELSSPNHSPSSELQLVSGGMQNEMVGFIERQVVKYIWTVVPTEVQDEYRITIDATFETNVPAPQIIITPGYVDLRGATLPTMIVYTVRNEGLVTARNVRVPETTAGGFTLTPLVRDIGDLAGGQVVQVPVLVMPSGRGGGCIDVAIDVHWQLPCGPFLNGYSGTAHVVLGVCTGKVPYPSPTPFGGGGGGGGGGPAGTRIYVGSPVVRQPIKCKSCTEKCVKALPSCVPLHDCYRILWDCGINLPDPSLGGSLKCIARGFRCLGREFSVWWFPPRWFSCGCRLIRDCAVTCVEGGPNFTCDAFDLVNLWLNDVLNPRRDHPPSNDPEYNFFVAQYERVVNLMAASWYMFGTRPFLEWDPSEEGIFDQWRIAISDTMDEQSDGAEMVTDAERAAAHEFERPHNITTTDVDAFIDRYNRSLTYYGLGIYNRADVPQGWSIDFIERDIISALYSRSLADMAEVEAEGFEGILEAMNFAVDALAAKRNRENEGVCATVKMRLDQTLTLTRSAFNATLEIENAGGASADPLDNINVAIVIRDLDGNDITSRFGIQPPTLRNLSGVDGTGTLGVNAVGSASWIIVPTDEAAPDGPTTAFVGGTFSYTIQGRTVVNTLFPVTINVLPNPKLQLAYFLEREVFADDPFTRDVIEPSVPFSLGLLVRNTGLGLARNVRIASSQPTIVENDRGLIIDFDIIGTRVGSAEMSPSLNVDLGDLAPVTGTGVATWLMTSTLQGQFTSYSARFTHVSPLNDTRLSLIDSVDTFTLDHVVRADGADDDDRPDFLTDDRPDLSDLPDRLHRSGGDVLPVVPMTDGDVDVVVGARRADVRVRSLPSGHFYVRLTDPFGGDLPLATIRRSDGKVIQAGWNAWQTNKVRRPRGGEPQPLRYIHLFDKGGDGRYEVLFDPPSNIPLPSITSQPVSQTACSGRSATFTVAAVGTGPLTYQWRRNGLAINNATFPTFTIAAVGPADAGTYDCVVSNVRGSVPSRVATLAVSTGPIIGLQPQGRVVCVGGVTSLSVLAVGTGQLSYQWRLNQQPIAGEVAATFVITNASVANAGLYDCIVTDTCGSVTSQAAPLQAVLPPAITQHPQPRVACLGTPTSFSVAATGAAPFSFQWRRDGAPIAGATQQTLAIASVASRDAGSYDCIVTNACGTATTQAASLDIPGRVTSQPSDASACVGGDLTLSVAAAHATGYAWLKDGTPLADGPQADGTLVVGATTATLRLSNVALNATGRYAARISTSQCPPNLSDEASVVISDPTIRANWNGPFTFIGGEQPAATTGSAMAFDANRGVTILFGGIGPQGYSAQTWAWNGETWLEAAAAGPAARSGAAMAFDAANGRIVMVGGEGPSGPLADAWAWDGAAWSPVPTPSTLTPRRNAAAAFDATRGRLVLFGGHGRLASGAAGHLDQTWEFDGTTWTLVATAVSPPAREGAAMAFDSARGVSVLFGGEGASRFADTWEWDGATWTQRVVPGPAARSFHTAVYDDRRSAVRVFGGDSGVARDDVWEFDGGAWMPLAVNGQSPGARKRHAAAYDTRRGRDVVWGGVNASGSEMAQAWTLTASNFGLAEQPSSASACQGLGVVLRAVPATPGAYTYRWYRSGTPLTDSDFITGSGTDTLQVTFIPSAVVGSYRCVVADACGEISSDAAAVEADGTDNIADGSFEEGAAAWQLPLGRSPTCDAGAARSGRCFVALDAGAGEATHVLARPIQRWEIAQLSVWARRLTPGETSFITLAAVNQSAGVVDGATFELADRWELFSFDVEASGVQDAVEAVRVSASANGANYAAAIDDVVLRVRCPADFNCDGGIDGVDIEVFVEAWATGDLSADANQDGGVDASDVDAFFEAWSSGGC